MVYVIQVMLTACEQLWANLHDIYHCCVYSEKLLMMDRGNVWNMYFYSKNKFEKLVHLVSFIIIILISVEVFFLWLPYLDWTHFNLHSMQDCDSETSNSCLTAKCHNKQWDKQLKTKMLLLILKPSNCETVFLTAYRTMLTSFAAQQKSSIQVQTSIYVSGKSQFAKWTSSSHSYILQCRLSSKKEKGPESGIIATSCTVSYQWLTKQNCKYNCKVTDKSHSYLGITSYNNDTRRKTLVLFHLQHVVVFYSITN
jgi:hypothetical protein